MKSVLLWFTVLSVLLESINGYKILGIFPIKSKSHHIVGSALMQGLAEKGHDVTMISAFPLQTSVRNYRDIKLTNIVDTMKGIGKSTLDMKKLGVIGASITFFDAGISWTNGFFNDPKVKEFMNNKTEEFDLIIVEYVINEAMLGFGQYFQAPLISVSSFGASIGTCDMVGSPSPPSYVSNPFLGFTDHMTLIERLGNLLFTIFERSYSDFFYLPWQKDIYNQAFPDPKPTFEEIRKNVSMVLLNTHTSVGYPRPYVPNMIEVGGMHINRKPQPLPVDFQKYLNESKEDVIYFSMGSNLESKQLPKGKLNHLLNTFKSLKQNVLWKWEDESLSGRTENMYISKWFPQDRILSHPNVKLFITHGGLLSITEAIYHGVPVIGIPMYGDQFYNMAKIATVYAGVIVQYDELTSGALKSAINEVLGNDLFKKSMQELSKRYRDQPMSPLDTAIYWVEYVARHRGALHLRSAGQDFSFSIYHNLDAIGILCGAALVTICSVIIVFRKILCFSKSLFYQVKTNKLE